MDATGNDASLALDVESEDAVHLDPVTSNPLSDGEIIAHTEPRDAIQERRDSSHQTGHLVSNHTDDLHDELTQTTLRPDPAPSRKRRESASAFASPEHVDRSDNHKKRKRAGSPPWQFPTAETTTLKTVDGRRLSARVNANTPPVASDVSAAASVRARSSSHSVPPASRIRPESPPWKKFAAAGPTSVVVDGKRKSGRVNKELAEPPKRVSPRTKRQSDRSGGDARVPAFKYSAGPKYTLNGGKRPKELPTTPRKAMKSSNRASDADDTIAKLRAQINALQPSRLDSSPERAYSHGHKRKRSYGVRTPRQNAATPPPEEESPSSQQPMSPDSQRKLPRLKLRFNAARYIVPPPHPQAAFPLRARPPRLSILQVLDRYDLQEMQQPYMENERGPPDATWFSQRAERQAVEEGAMRRKIIEEAEFGGRLSKERLSLYKNADAQGEPPKQYGHNDHLIAHALHLRELQRREKTHHRNLAKKVAHEALEHWRAMRGPTEEDIREEQDKLFKLVYKQIVTDIKSKWALMEQSVITHRLQARQAEEELKRQARLQEQLEWSENMVARQRGEADDHSADNFASDEDADEEATTDESEEENMTESSSAAEDDDDDGDGLGQNGEMDAHELAAYQAYRLAQSEMHPVDDDDDDISAVPLEHPQSSQDILPESELDSGMLNRKGRLDHVSMADLLEDGGLGDKANDDEFRLHSGDERTHLSEERETDAERSLKRSKRSSAVPSIASDDEQDFSSDESTNMDSTDYDSDEDMSSSDADDASENEAEESEDGDHVPNTSLLSLFKDDLQAIGLPTPTSAEGDLGETQIDAETVVPDDVEHSSPMIVKMEELDENGGHDSTVREQSPAIVPSLSDESEVEPLADPNVTKYLVPSPSLLRGTLRSYQHAGLDWLASLYRNGTNGILADEMGLGKTIQTIALLAHLAEEHECWDPHLVIVPTSVVLNWVTEFQKFLPGFRVLGYYGTSEERQQKRKGWVNDPHHEKKELRGYNVIITSYHVAMQDINAIRNVQWHYLVLDEAHNIRNFNSQRWQVLIRLKTRARLLLTGTPLQNSLSELWSLLTFLTAGDDDPKHGDLEEFLSHWKEPVKEIFDRGVQILSSEAQRVVDQLHISLRPFLLRRLKSEVEKDLPKKTESVVVCKLSRRQRELYQDYMGLAETKKSLTQGNAVSAGKVLLSLRRVCNHPDLFDPRPIQTSLGMEYSALDPYAIKERIVRKLLGTLGEVPVPVTAFEDTRRYVIRRAKQLHATTRLEDELARLEQQRADHLKPDATTVAGSQMLQRLQDQRKAVAKLRASIQISKHNSNAVPVYGSDLIEILTVHRDQPYRVAAKDIRGRVLSRTLRGWPAVGRFPLRFEMEHVSDWLLSQTSVLQRDTATAQSYAQQMHDSIVRFAFCTPPVTAPVLGYAIPERVQRLIRASEVYPIQEDEAHEARIRTSIAFPDSRLLVYDAGKLQQLTVLLRELQSRGSRSLIFTQMTGTLNILEQFLSLLNLPYLRLDGSTPVERRALYAAEFNRPDSKYQCMILSSRAGGVGLNLIGASSVIFYDLDWNPQMDRQCMDRAHRIGQVRDVEVYKMVSEKTVEENILRRANQKSLLDQTVIQDGHFTTEYQRPQQATEDEDDADVAAAIERFLGGNSERATNQALESVEDREDVQAAQQARKEDHQDDADFADRSSKGPSAAVTPGPGFDSGNAMDGEGNLIDKNGYPVDVVYVDGKEEKYQHVDSWMLNLLDDFLLRNVHVSLPAVRKVDRHGRDPSHRKRKR